MPSDLISPRIQLIHVSPPRRPLEEILGHQIARRRSVLNAPTRVSRRNPQPLHRRRANERVGLAVGRPLVLREVAALLRLDGRVAQLRRDGRRVRNQVVALDGVALDLVGGFG
jgi:hypothetical protein